jgi:CheY-like chemotaxis protein
MSVLLVEDDALVRECLSEMLGEMGLRVAALPNASEALALPDGAEAPSVLVTDVRLGAGLDGFALAAAARDRWPGIHAVLISGDARSAEHALAPTESFLAKPFRMDDLVQAIRGGHGVHLAVLS